MRRTNQDLIQQILQLLNETQVETIVVCAGARNAPLVLELEKQKNQKCFSFFEERSAGFFALGLVKSSQKPVAIVTTSGTAVAELLPSCIESYYQGLPVLFITADRPKRYRGSGAPQSIEQAGIFSGYVESALDWDEETESFKVSWDQKKSLHLNVCFDEPLLDKPSSNFQVQKNSLDCFKEKQQITDQNNIAMQEPLIILGQIDQNYLMPVIKWLSETTGPIYAESLSQLRGCAEISERLIISSDEIVKKLFRNKICQSVIRIGGVPTLRFWRDLELEFKEVKVLNITNLAFSGLSRQSEMIPLSNLDKIIVKTTKENDLAIIDLEWQRQKMNLLNQFVDSEPNFIRQFSHLIKNEPLYLGNSLPIREWDQFAQAFESQSIYANRGANGIDGQISTYLGWSESHNKSWCLVGDLTALYDLASLGLTSQLTQHQRRIVVMNNRGGHIFKKLFDSHLFLNSHKIEFYHWAKMWGWDYLKVNSVADFSKIASSDKSNNLIIELQPNTQQSDQFWKQWDELCKK